MKHSLLFVLCVLVISLVSCRLTTENEGLSSDMVITKIDPDATVDEHAILTFDEPVFDFGTLSQGERVDHTFTFENTGDAPLLITAIKPSCGCTLPKQWPKDPIAPGEGGDIVVEFNSDRKSGKQNKSINIVCNGLPQTVVLYLKGEVIAPDL